MEKNVDCGNALKALRELSKCLQKHEEAQSSLYLAGGLTPGDSLKKINDRINFVKMMVTAHNKAEDSLSENDSAPLHPSRTRRRKERGKTQESMRFRKEAGRDRKMHLIAARNGDFDMVTDRLFFDEGDDGGQWAVFKH